MKCEKEILPSIDYEIQHVIVLCGASRNSFFNCTFTDTFYQCVRIDNEL